MSPDLTLCQWRVRSETPIPDLLPWGGDDRVPDLVIRLGEVPPPSDLVHNGPLLQIGASGACRFALPGVAAYGVSPAGDEVVIDAVLDPASADVRVFLLGTVLAILCFKRGLIPLHASCVRLGGRAVAFVGASGFGKSTLAGAFVRQGVRLLADDVTVLDVTTPGGPLVLPAFPRLKLRLDAARELGLPVEGAERCQRMVEKLHLPVEAFFHPQPLPLAAVYHLQGAREESASDAVDRVAPFSNVESVLALHQGLYRMRLGERLLGRSALFAAAGRLCSAVPGFKLVHRGGGLGDLPRLAESVARRHQAAEAPER
ncbi:MAG: hypothetical protein HQL51_12680 [Magnetococcales bacterium]|nr:hypothetical protein [Magnetococcales bacterium]